MKLVFTFACLLAVRCFADDPVAAWSKDVRIKPVSSAEGRHSIHTYYVTNPESPDGKHVLFFTSTHPAGYVGEVPPAREAVAVRGLPRGVNVEISGVAVRG